MLILVCFVWGFFLGLGFFTASEKDLYVYLQSNSALILFCPVIPRQNQFYHTLSVIINGNLQRLARSNLQEYDSKELELPKISPDVGNEGICWQPIRHVKSEEMLLRRPWDRRWHVPHVGVQHHRTHSQSQLKYLVSLLHLK